MPSVIVDGWWLTQPGVGLASYTARLVDLLPRLETGDTSFAVAFPSWYRPKLPPTVHALPMRAIRTGHDLIDSTLWQSRLGFAARRAGTGTALWSPGPFWAPVAPRQTWVVHHDCLYRHFPAYQGRRVVRKWMLGRKEAFLRRCESVMTASEFSRQEIIRFAGVDGARVSVIPAWLPPAYDPVTAPRQASAVRTRYKLPARYWLYVGGYDLRKDVGVLIDAYARTAQHCACPPLVLAGRIPTDMSKPVCNVHGAISRHGLTSSQVVMPGFVAEEDMPGLFGGAELTVYPSRYEGYGLPPLEAMGCGCPAVVADNSSLPEVVSDADWRFETGSAEGLALILGRAAGMPLRLNPAFCRARYSEDEAILAYRRVLNRFLDSRAMSIPAGDHGAPAGPGN